MNLSTFFVIFAGTAAPAATPPPANHIVYANWHDQVMLGMRQVERAVARHALAEYALTGVLPTYSAVGTALESTLVPTYGFMPREYQTLHWHARVADLLTETGVVICAHTPAPPGASESRALSSVVQQLPAGRAWLSDTCGSPGAPLTGANGVTVNFSIPTSLIHAYLRTTTIGREAGDSPAPAPAPAPVPAPAPGAAPGAGGGGPPGTAMPIEIPREEAATVVQNAQSKKYQWVIVPGRGRPDR